MQFGKVGIGTAIAVALGGCGSAGVTFQKAGSATAVGAAPVDVMKVATAASQGAVDFNVPVSEIAVHVASPSKPEQPSTAHTAGAAIRNHGSATANKAASGAPPPAATAGTSPPGTGTPSGSINETAPAAPATGATTTVNALTNSVVSIAVLPADSALSLRATGVNSFFSKNQLGITRYANTDIPVAVTNQFTDLTQSRLQTVGTIITAAITTSVAFGAAAPTTAPSCPSDPQDFSFVVGSLDDLNVSHDVDMNKCFSYTVSNDANHHAPDTITRQQFLDTYTTGTPISFWPIPACMQATLTIRDQTQKTYATTPLTIVDPGYVGLLRLPDQGKIAMHPVCNADLTDSPVDKWQTAEDAITTLLQEVQNVQKAVNPGTTTDPSGGTKKAASASASGSTSAPAATAAAAASQPPGKTPPLASSPAAMPAAAHIREIIDPGNDVDKKN